MGQNHILDLSSEKAMLVLAYDGSISYATPQSAKASDASRDLVWISTAILYLDCMFMHVRLVPSFARASDGRHSSGGNVE